MTWLQLLAAIQSLPANVQQQAAYAFPFDASPADPLVAVVSVVNLQAGVAFLDTAQIPPRVQPSLKPAVPHK